MGRSQLCTGGRRRDAALSTELFAGARPTVQSDIYSVGILLFHLVTGTYLFGREVLTIFVVPTRKANVSASPLRGRIPARLTRIIERATDPRPDRRHRSASDIAEELRRHRDVLAGAGVLRCCRFRSWSHSWRPCRPFSGFAATPLKRRPRRAPLDLPSRF